MQGNNWLRLMYLYDSNPSNQHTSQHCTTDHHTDLRIASEPPVYYVTPESCKNMNPTTYFVHRIKQCSFPWQELHPLSVAWTRPSFPPFRFPIRAVCIPQALASAPFPHTWYQPLLPPLHIMVSYLAALLPSYWYLLLLQIIRRRENLINRNDVDTRSQTIGDLLVSRLGVARELANQGPSAGPVFQRQNEIHFAC